MNDPMFEMTYRIISQDTDVEGEYITWGFAKDFKTAIAIRDMLVEKEKQCFGVEELS